MPTAAVRRRLYDLADGMADRPACTRDLYDVLEAEAVAVLGPDHPGYDALSRYCWMIAEEFTEGPSF